MNYLDDDTRSNLLVMHVAKVVRDGGQIEEHSRFRAIVRCKTKIDAIPNIVIIAVACALFIVAKGLLFLAAIALSCFSLYRKIEQSSQVRRLLLRIDELGQISELELDATTA